MDLNSDRVVRSYVFKESVLKPTSALVNLEIDVEVGKCDDAFAYIPDLLGYGLVVYSYKEDNSWRVDHDYFKYENDAKEFHIGGLSFEWEDGVFSIALSKERPDGFKDAYFHAMSGTHMYKVSTKVLKNQTLATRPNHGDDFQVIKPLLCVIVKFGENSCFRTLEIAVNYHRLQPLNCIRQLVFCLWEWLIKMRWGVGTLTNHSNRRILI